jgi:hypothetical protein
MDKKYWFSVDSDDVHHHPSLSGHPTRSSISPWCLDLNSRSMSNALIESFHLLEEWWISRKEDELLTIFIIAEQLEDPKFVEAIQNLKSSRSGLTIGVHGLKHICWSAWGNCSDDFDKSLKKSIALIRNVAGETFRPWFRAPGGYIAPWMIPILKDHGIVLDSSINPVKLMKRKTGRDENGKINGWKNLIHEFNKKGIVEREWLVSNGMPTNGPALHIPLLRTHSKWVWKRKLSGSRCVNENELLDPNISVNSIYWHVLDHGRKGGWTPPIP